MSTPSALHSKKTVKWGTPAHIVTCGRQLLDNQIDLDPASSEQFNKIIQATCYYTETINGLNQIWMGNTFVNPPGGLIKDFWLKLIESILKGWVEKAFWVGFSVEQLCVLADLDYHPLDFSICILRKRIAFNTEQLTKGESPAHGNYVTGLGVDKVLFSKLFDSQGKVIHGPLT